MKKDVIISLKGTQSDGTDEEVTELVTEGQYYEKNGKQYITYKESELTGMEGTTTTLKIEGEKVTMMRFGQNNTQLIFEQGQRHVSCYDTPYGSFTIGVNSKSVNVNLNENGGNITADYLIDVNNAETGHNNFYMHVRENI